MISVFEFLDMYSCPYCFDTSFPDLYKASPNNIEAVGAIMYDTGDQNDVLFSVVTQARTDVRLQGKIDFNLDT